MKKGTHSLFPQGVHDPIFTHLKKRRRITLSGLGNTTAKSFLISDLVINFSPRQIIWIVNNAEEFTTASKNLSFWDLDDFYAWDVKMDDTEKDQSKMVTTLGVLYGRSPTPPPIILLSRQAFLSPLPTPTELKTQSLTLTNNQELQSFDVINFLIESGYKLNPDQILNYGEYRQDGGMLTIFPPNTPHPLKIEFTGNEIAGLYFFDQNTKQLIHETDNYQIWPLRFKNPSGSLADHLPLDPILVQDELDIEDIDTERCLELLSQTAPRKQVIFTAFPDDNDQDFFHLHYLSVLRFYNFHDLVNDLREKKATGWHCVISTRQITEITNILLEEKITFSTEKDPQPAQIHIVNAAEHKTVPLSFQNSETKITLLTDREITQLKKRSFTQTQQKVYLDFLTKLKIGDYVVHIDNGIGIFLGTEKRTIDSITREYLKIGYAQGDRLFVPIDQAEKTNKYIGQEDRPPHLTRLGSAEWKNITSRVRQETEKVAQELLQLYARREQAQGVKFTPDTPEQTTFEKTFPYEETPGQLRALRDVKADMESLKQMDRLVCGDVGFGKTEVALRAAFKAVQSGYQVAFISPITILADQHYKTCCERMANFPLRVEMLSRFRSPAEQRQIITDLKNGKIDIIVGTHRLLQSDIDFQKLGLIIIDEEQRFGVKQKETIQKLRAEVDVLTLTATPIPRTLNMALNGIRDISTITTPPPGRLPVITEVRRYSENLIQTVIQKELDRKGQIYFLHNRVQTIESMADKIRSLLPHARVIVGHGKLSPAELEKRILAFKNGEYDILVSSTIIENGIDLSNANTLIVNNADQFGLSQLYQLRGRVGRGKAQAYSYFLYQAQRLTLESKKRLRAIVEAAELGSGFQIAMRDLEIRGAGDILGVNQHGAINVVGVTHFVRLLRQAVEELKSGRGPAKKSSPEEEVAIEVPISGYIPDSFIEDSRDKINVYQRLSSADTLKDLENLRIELEDEYGHIPTEVKNLFRVLELKIYARRAGITNIRSTNLGQGKRELSLTMGQKVKPENIFNLLTAEPEWKVSGNKLKIDMARLGVHWPEKTRIALDHLAKKVAISTPNR